MNLNNTLMLNTHMVYDQWCKPDFDFSQLWKCVTDGTMEAFQHRVLSRSRFQKPLAEQILFCLASQTSAPTFLQGGQVDTKGLQSCLEPFWANSFGEDDSFFFPRNHAVLEAIRPLNNLSNRAGWDLYLFLLLHLQIKPKEPVRRQDLDFLLSLLETTDAKSDLSHPHLALYRGQVWRCLGQALAVYRNGGWQTVHTESEPFAGLCASDRLGIIAFTVSGKLSSFTSPVIRAAAEGKIIRQAAAFGSHYILVCEDGSLITDFKDLPWQDVTAVSLGLNSAAAIYGPHRRLLSVHSDSALTNYTDVESISTRNDGKFRYAVLRQSGDLHMSGSDHVISGVRAACLSPMGCVFIQGRSLYLWDGTASPHCLKELPEDISADELHVREHLIICGSAERVLLLSAPLPG